MHRLLIPLAAILFLAACGNQSADEPQDTEDTAAAPEAVLVWQATLNDSTGLLEMKQVFSEGADLSSASAIIGSINQQYPEIKLEFVRSSNDTVFLKIQDAHYLTQQMGSSGSTMYVAGLVYNLTSLPGTGFVHLDFTPGDHAQPGTYSRESFVNQ